MGNRVSNRLPQSVIIKMVSWCATNDSKKTFDGKKHMEVIAAMKNAGAIPTDQGVTEANLVSFLKDLDPSLQWKPYTKVTSKNRYTQVIKNKEAIADLQVKIDDLETLVLQQAEQINALRESLQQKDPNAFLTTCPVNFGYPNSQYKPNPPRTILTDVSKTLNPKT